MEPKLKHDFTNNCLRIEILQKLLLEKLDNGQAPEQEHLKDYIVFLEEQKAFAGELLRK